MENDICLSVENKVPKEKTIALLWGGEPKHREEPTSVFNPVEDSQDKDAHL